MCFVCLTAYQILMGYQMLTFDPLKMFEGNNIYFSMFQGIF